MSKSYEVVMVEWQDSTCRTRWHSLDQAPKFPDQCITVGLLIRRDRESITVAQSTCEDRSFDSSWLIPRVNIKKIHHLIKVKAPDARKE